MCPVLIVQSHLKRCPTAPSSRNPQPSPAPSCRDRGVSLQVQAAIDNCMQGRTVVIIAHRLSTVRRADRIIVLKQVPPRCR